MGVLTDEEFKRGMRELAAESVMEASDADLEAWLAARTSARQLKATPREQAGTRARSNSSPCPTTYS